MSENTPEPADISTPTSALSPEPLKFDAPQFDIVEKGADQSGFETRDLTVDGD